MSSITISWIKNRLSPEEVYRETREWLDKSFKEVIQSIKERVKTLSERYPHLPKLVNHDIKTLEFKAEQYLNTYTEDIARTPYHDKLVENWVKDFNEEALRIKRKIAEYVLDTDKKKEELANLIRQLKEIEIPDESPLKKELIALKKKIYHLIKDKKFIDAFEEILIFLPKAKALELQYIEQKKREEQQEKTQENLSITEKHEIQQEKIKRKEFEELDKLKLEITSYLNMIESLDGNIFNSLKKYQEIVKYSTDTKQLETIKEKIKNEYRQLRKNITLTKVFREDIKEMIQKTDIDELIQKGEELLHQKYITSKEYLEFYEEYVYLTSQQKKKKEVVHKLREAFEELGYKFKEEQKPELRLYKGDITYLDTPMGDQYKLAVKLEGNKLITRFTRLVADEKELASLSSYEKIKDVEKAKEWCSDYEKLLQVAEEKGIEMEPKLIVEPNIDKIYYEIAEEVYELLRIKKKKEKEKQSLKERKREL